MSAQNDDNAKHTSVLRIAVAADHTACESGGSHDPGSKTTLFGRASTLASELGLPLIELEDRTNDVISKEIDVLFAVTQFRLELRILGGDPITRGGRPVFCDLSQINITAPAATRHKQPIAKAIGLKSGQPKPIVIDATAGWGEDSWLIAALGCQVIALERSPIVAALLRDGLSRAVALNPKVAERIEMIQVDALHQLTHWPSNLPDPDVIFLDPMFPPRRKGAEGKPMRVLRQLIGNDNDAGKLLPTAKQLAKKRVVVKRPLHGPHLNNEKPVATHKGKSLRYDVYVNLKAD